MPVLSPTKRRSELVLARMTEGLLYIQLTQGLAYTGAPALKKTSVTAGQPGARASKVLARTVLPQGQNRR